MKNNKISILKSADFKPFFRGYKKLNCINCWIYISSTRLFVIQSHEYRTEMHQRLILWCISKILVQPFLSFGAFETAFGASILGFGAFETAFGATIFDFGAFETVFGASILDFGAFETVFGASIFDFGAFETAFGATIFGFGAFETVLGASIFGFGAF